jgi:ADP-ribose pyrophosphatase YjhB (NUDIX family)
MANHVQLPHMTLLQATRNKYDGIYIHPDTLPVGIKEFEEMLGNSLQHWTSDNIRLVWLFFPAAHAHLVPAAISHGFAYHHCTGSEIMMVRRLVKSAAIPSFATHTIGAGGIVISPQQNILTVVERRDREFRPGHYKLPGGMLEPGEHIADGVVREVFEETGIRTEFQGLVGFRHHHSGQFGTSNIYAVCLLTPLGYDIVIDEAEISEAVWMPVDEYLQNSDVGLYNRHVVSAALSGSPLGSVKIDGYRDGPDDYEVYSPPTDLLQKGETSHEMH